MLMIIRKFLCFAAALLLAASTAHAVPKLISYQGLLNDQSGTPINASVSFTFGIYSAPSGGTALWTETQANVQVTNGVFNVQLGSVQTLPASIFTTDTLYLGIKANADAEMTPRQRLTSQSYAISAEQITGAVLPSSDGRDNSIKSYFVESPGASGGIALQSFVIPADKNFIITDISHHWTVGCAGGGYLSSCLVQYTLSGVTTTIYKAVASITLTSPNLYSDTHESYRSGLPVPAGATLKFGAFNSSEPVACYSACIVAGYEVSVTP